MIKGLVGVTLVKMMTLRVGEDRLVEGDLVEDPNHLQEVAVVVMVDTAIPMQSVTHGVMSLSTWRPLFWS